MLGNVYAVSHTISKHKIKECYMDLWKEAATCYFKTQQETQFSLVYTNVWERHTFWSLQLLLQVSSINI